MQNLGIVHGLFCNEFCVWLFFFYQCIFNISAYVSSSVRNFLSLCMFLIFLFSAACKHSNMHRLLLLLRALRQSRDMLGQAQVQQEVSSATVHVFISTTITDTWHVNLVNKYFPTPFYQSAPVCRACSGGIIHDQLCITHTMWPFLHTLVCLQRTVGKMLYFPPYSSPFKVIPQFDSII